MPGVEIFRFWVLEIEASLNVVVRDPVFGLERRGHIFRRVHLDHVQEFTLEVLRVVEGPDHVEAVVFLMLLHVLENGIGTAGKVLSGVGDDEHEVLVDLLRLSVGSQCGAAQFLIGGADDRMMLDLINQLLFREPNR